MRKSKLLVLFSILTVSAMLFAGGESCSSAKQAGMKAGGEECSSKTAKQAGLKVDQSTLHQKVAAMRDMPWHGFKLERTESGFYAVTEVVSDSPAYAAGFHKGDVILTINGVKAHEKNKEALKALKTELSIGSKVAYLVKRDGAKQKLSATLARAPEDVIASRIGYYILENYNAESIAAN